MDSHILDLLTLALTPSLGARRVASLVRADGVEELCRHPSRFAHLLPPSALEELNNGSARRRADSVFKDATRLSQRVVALGSPEYPAALAALYDPPPVLFVRGSLASGRRRVAIVGARGATPGGRTMAQDLARGLARSDIEIVSGLARGIDGAAHEGALSGGGMTVAVLGSSIDIVYPPEHASLAKRVSDRGAVVSEHPPGTPPAASQFPTRNRIIVGMSEAVIVVEAGSRSGALITARVALEEGRDVLAVPGRPADPLSFGPNLLIRDGAPLVRGIDDVLEHLGLLPAQGCQAPAAAKDPVLVELEKSGVRSIDQLIADTGLDTSRLMVRLSELELEGRVERLPGTLFRSATPA